MIVFLMLLGLVGLVTSHGVARQPSNLAEVTSAGQRMRQYRRLPLIFEKNQGQTDARVKFLARGESYTLFLTPQEAVLALRAQGNAGKANGSVVRVRLEGAEARAEIQGEEELGGESNYFVGKEASGWHTHIPTYGRVRYGGVYPGVDLEYYGRQGEVEYDFIVGAGSDAGRLGLGIEGVERMEVDRGGDLVLRVGGGELRWRRPEAYQELRGERRRIEAGYVVHDGKEVGFSLGAYDHRAPLIIDPVLTYATYLGGTGGDVAYGIAVDASGNAYITGLTNSTDLATAGAEQG